MATMTTSKLNATAGGVHPTGIYTDMSIEGPEIGTLVVVFDRAKNLPNRRTVGKQDPYCAARLGKEAKKTETDKRGGQTPRWDQELRFTVHESPDYSNLKISVFNDDKKTDLIGEAWINLDDILRKGGGQADGWHGLNFKGKYAGEIRVELTFYDSRPRSPGKREKREKESIAEDLGTQASTTPGPRPPHAVKRRPVPSVEAAELPSSAAKSAASNSVPVPTSALRSYHTPPRQKPVQEATEPYDDSPQYSSPPAESLSRPLPNPLAASTQSHGRSQASTAPMRYSSPPEGEPVYYEPPIKNGQYESHQYDWYHEDDRYYEQDTSFDSSRGEYEDLPEPLPPHRHGHNGYLQPAPPRHERIMALSSSPPVRSSPPSVPQPHYPSQYVAREEPYQYQQHSHRPKRLSDASSPSPLANERPQTFPNQSPFSRPSPNLLHAAAPAGRQLPPLPPSHSHSAPAVPRSGDAYTPSRADQGMPPRQPLRVSTTVDDFSPNRTYDQRDARQYREDYGPHSAQPSYSPRGPGANYSPHRQNSAEAILYQSRDARQDDGQGYETRYQEGYTSPSQRQPDYRRSFGHYSPEANRDQAPFDMREQYPPRPRSYMGTPTSSPPQHPMARGFVPQPSTPNWNPGPASPGASGDNPSPFTPSNGRKPVTPASAKTTSSSFYSPDSFDVLNPNLKKLSVTSDSKEPAPMYASQRGTSQNHVSESTPEVMKLNEPIVGSDGRIKDPSDHLPISSYAPEPESKGSTNRPSTTARNHFGPRDAATRTTASPQGPFSSPAPGRLQNRSSALNSPLSPASSSMINSNFSSPYPPPVPGKIPLSNTIDDYEPGGNMSALSDELAGIDIGPGPSPGKGGKVKKSRFIMS